MQQGDWQLLPSRKNALDHFNVGHPQLEQSKLWNLVQLAWFGQALDYLGVANTSKVCFNFIQCKTNFS